MTTIHEVGNYRVSIFGASPTQGFAKGASATISLFDSHHKIRASIVFMPDDSDLPKSTKPDLPPNDWYCVYMYVGNFNRVLDLLRNEENLEFFWNDESSNGIRSDYGHKAK